MNSEERLNRVLGASAAPAKDLHFTLLVMRRAEQERFRAALVRRLIWGAALAILAVAAGLPLVGWLAANPGATEDTALALGALGAVWALSGGARRAAFGRAR
ncbi:MAG: hypothetical protein M0D54_13305 [Hyphomonadaceae bacterium JAD_PAG50586_4]|nr:MAG: hypothetical protein M0D54_13305 [Hyphomonadaceae bacterium JAD_PAG50586_4]